MNMNKKKIIIDTDCGSDDAIALAMALNDEAYEIIMITTVSGNVRVKQATQNVLSVLKKVDRYYPPVYIGADHMLKRDWVGASDTHGHDGMGDHSLVDYSLKCAEGDAVERILEALKDYKDKQIDLIALGPLTNIALALKKDPETMNRLDRLIIMGSAGFGPGNMTPTAEFNVWQDPDSCQIVLDSQIDKKIFVGWDACTDEAMLNDDEIMKISDHSDLGKYLIDANTILLEMNMERFDRRCLDLADPVAMSVALNAECIDICEPYYCKAVTEHGDLYGTFLIEDTEDKKTNAYVCHKIKASVFKKYLFNCLGID